jgi:hypothetical protein
MEIMDHAKPCTSCFYGSPLGSDVFFNEALMIDAYEPFALYHLARLRAVQGYPEKARGSLQRLRDVDGAADMAAELAGLLGEEAQRQRTPDD